MARTSVAIPWARILAEGAIIVASILLALAVDAWWQDRSARGDARRALASVQVELGEALSEVRSGADLHARLQVVNGALEDAVQRAPRNSSFGVPDSLLAGLLLLHVPDPPTSAIDNFVAAGHLEYVESAELRRELLGISAALYDLADDEVRARSFQDLEAMPFLRANFDIAAAQVAAVDLAARREVAPGETRLVASDRLRNFVGWQSGWFDLLTRQSNSVLGRLENLQRLVEVELAD